MRLVFRKYHRLIALTMCLPLIITAVTGIAMTVADEWLHQAELVGFLLKIHTFQFLGLSTILPIFNGLGLLSLIATGLNMMGLFSKWQKSKQIKK
jgi:glycogen synthase